MFSDESGAIRKSDRPTSSCWTGREETRTWAWLSRERSKPYFRPSTRYISERGLCRDKSQLQPILVNPQRMLLKLNEKINSGYYVDLCHLCRSTEFCSIS